MPLAQALLDAQGIGGRCARTAQGGGVDPSRSSSAGGDAKANHCWHRGGEKHGNPDAAGRAGGARVSIRNKSTTISHIKSTSCSHIKITTISRDKSIRRSHR